MAHPSDMAPGTHGIESQGSDSRSEERRSLPLEGFLAANNSRETALKSDQLLKAIEVPGQDKFTFQASPEAADTARC